MTEPAADPFAALKEMREPLRERARRLILHGPVVEELLRLGDALEAAYQTAADMELGASSFDNTTSMAHYGGMRRHLFAAAQDLVAAAHELLR